MTDPMHQPLSSPADDLATPVDTPTTTPPVTEAAGPGTPVAGTPVTGTPVTGTSATPSDSLTPLYAAAGLAEVVMTNLRSRIAQAQAQAKEGAAGKGRIADLQQQLKTYRDQVTTGYSSLATRGKPTVDSTLVTVRHLSGRAERKVDDLKDAATPSDPTPADQVPPVVVQPVVVVEPTDSDRTPGAAG